MTSTTTPAPCCDPVLAGPLDPGDADVLAAGFRALSDPVRLRLLSLVGATTEVCACDLPDLVDRSQSTVSHHMKALVDAGLGAGLLDWRELSPERLAQASGIGKVTAERLGVAFSETSHRGFPQWLSALGAPSAGGISEHDSWRTLATLDAADWRRRPGVGVVGARRWRAFLSHPEVVVLARQLADAGIAGFVGAFDDDATRSSATPGSAGPLHRPLNRPSHSPSNRPPASPLHRAPASPSATRLKSDAGARLEIDAAPWLASPPW